MEWDRHLHRRVVSSSRPAVQELLGFEWALTQAETVEGLNFAVLALT
jgi:hypothetical protein